MEQKHTPAHPDEGKIDYKFVHDSKCEIISAVERYFRRDVDDDLEGNIANILSKVAFNEAERKPNPYTYLEDLKQENQRLKDFVEDVLGICGADDDMDVIVETIAKYATKVKKELTHE